MSARLDAIVRAATPRPWYVISERLRHVGDGKPGLATTRPALTAGALRLRGIEEPQPETRRPDPPSPAAELVGPTDLLPMQASPPEPGVERNEHYRQSRGACLRVSRVVVAATAGAFGIPAGDLLGQSRSRPVSWSRFAVALILRERGYSAPAIGAALRRDHSTILTAVQSARRLARLDPDWSRRCALAREATARRLAGDLGAIADLCETAYRPPACQPVRSDSRLGPLVVRMRAEGRTFGEIGAALDLATASAKHLYRYWIDRDADR